MTRSALLSRRESSPAIVLAEAPLAPAAPPSRPAGWSSASSTPLRVGVLGCGTLGSQLVRQLDDLGDTKPRIVCDLRRDRLEALCGNRPHLAATRAIADLLRSPVDAIAIATPAETCCALARVALEAGKHVAIARPLVAPSRQIRKLAELADRQRLALMVGHWFDYDPALETLARLARSRALGKIHHIDASRASLGPAHARASVLEDLAIHDIYIAQRIMGRQPSAVSARGQACLRPHRRDLLDVVSLTLEFPGGAFATLRASRLDPTDAQRITVVGDRRMAVCDAASEAGLALHPSPAALFPDREAPPNGTLISEGNAMGLVGDADGEIAGEIATDFASPSASSEPTLRRQWRHFAACVRDRKTPRSDGRAAFHAVQVLEAARFSLENDGIRVPLSAGEFAGQRLAIASDVA